MYYECELSRSRVTLVCVLWHRVCSVELRRKASCHTSNMAGNYLLIRTPIFDRVGQKVAECLGLGISSVN